MLRADRLLAEARASASQPDPAANESRVLRIFARAVDSQPLACSCFPRTLALRSVLRRHGIEARLEVGMRRGKHGLEGHAWLEREGKVFGGDGRGFVGSFLRFERLG